MDFVKVDITNSGTLSLSFAKLMTKMEKFGNLLNTKDIDVKSLKFQIIYKLGVLLHETTLLTSFHIVKRVSNGIIAHIYGNNINIRILLIFYYI